MEKTMMLGKIQGKDRGRKRMIWSNYNSNSMSLSLSKLHEIVENREAWHASVHGVAESNMT